MRQSVLFVSRLLVCCSILGPLLFIVYTPFSTMSSFLPLNRRCTHFLVFLATSLRDTLQHLFTDDYKSFDCQLLKKMSFFSLVLNNNQPKDITADILLAIWVLCLMNTLLSVIKLSFSQSFSFYSRLSLPQADLLEL